MYNENNTKRKIMTLDEYFDKYCINIKSWCKSHGFSSHTIHKWKRKERFPKKSSVEKIMKATNGEVTNKDFPR